MWGRFKAWPEGKEEGLEPLGRWLGLPSFHLISILGLLERRGSYDLVGIIGIFGRKLKGVHAKENPWFCHLTESLVCFIRPLFDSTSVRQSTPSTQSYRSHWKQDP
jgi:hypothetical protein